MTDDSTKRPDDESDAAGSEKRRYRLLAFVEGETYGGKRATAEDVVPTWPHLVFREFLIALGVIVAVWVVSIAFDAPLEAEANPALTPNPAKAPWYFVGLQELLVYFDPWIAGVMIPLTIVFGLLAIPYLDTNARGTGEYAFDRRKFAVTVLTLGAVFWFLLIFIGMFLRGPNWAWYWPWEDWTLPKQTVFATRNLSLPVGCSLLIGYLAVGMIAPAFCCRKFRDDLGWTRYIITMLLLLFMIAVPAKIVLRLAFDIKYVLVTPWFNI
ncbi:MAG: hypothetical protein IH991_02230 [Planctomycetes bacterium]|nr:hypothetical protein [Planctomycetota bacterium]